MVSCAVGIGKWYTTPSDLQYKIVQKGSGPAAKNGNQVLIEESTSYTDGKVIFSTDQIGQPLRITLGANQVISGVDEGVNGMRAGEIRELRVPPKLSKRSLYPANIHPDSTLVYKIKLVEIL